MEYTIVVNGKPEGPYQLEQLKTLNIRPETFVRKPGMDDYKEAHEFMELRELLGFHFQQAVPQYFASFDQRLVAHVIDYLCIISGYIIIGFVLYTFMELNALRIIMIAIIPFLALFKLIYGSIAEATTKQATIGKRLMDIKVTDDAGQRLTLANSFGRNFAKIISNFTLGFGYLYCFLNKKQQCLHDLIAHTLVIKQRLM